MRQKAEEKWGIKASSAAFDHKPHQHHNSETSSYVFDREYAVLEHQSASQNNYKGSLFIGRWVVIKVWKINK